jgi:hypothetical protein
MTDEAVQYEQGCCWKYLTAITTIPVEGKALGKVLPEKASSNSAFTLALAKTCSTAFGFQRLLVYLSHLISNLEECEPFGQNSVGLLCQFSLGFFPWR